MCGRDAVVLASFSPEPPVERALPAFMARRMPAGSSLSSQLHASSLGDRERKRHHEPDVAMDHELTLGFLAAAEADR